MSAHVDLSAVFRPSAQSVWVVTSRSGGPAVPSPVGFTAVSVTSVSVDPPVVAFNVGRRSSSLDALRTSGRFAVHLLGADQAELATRFAGPAASRFVDDGRWELDDDAVPRLRATVARAAGSILSWTEAGDSLIVVGRVLTTEVSGGPPLLCHHRAFFPLTVPAPLEPIR